MRMSTLFALSFLGLLAGCNSSTAPAPQAAPAAKPIADHVGGRVMLREPRELSAQSKLELKIADVAQPDMVLAQTTVSPANAPPIMFNLPIDTTKVDAKRTYAVEAILTDGDRRYLPVLQYPVLTHNAPSTVEVMMAPEPTPSEKMYEDFKKTLGQIGGMKSINGSALNDNASVAWDAFVQGTNAGPKVRVVREITDLDGDKGRITYKMAYQNDKPWVAVKEEAPAGSNHPFATTRVGWDDNGQLVLKEHSTGGQNTEVSADDAKAIYEHARQALATAQTKVPKK